MLALAALPLLAQQEIAPRADFGPPVRSLAEAAQAATPCGDEPQLFVGPSLPPGTTISRSAQSPPSGTFAASWRVENVTIATPAGNESFLFQDAPSSLPQPVLVLFHRYNVSQLDAFVHTDYFAEAAARGWLCVAPLGGNSRHFSSLASQVRTEAALEWIDARYLIDRSRIYAVGFSMGGGAALDYAARHLDPDGYMFAAVASISGILSLEDTYLNEPSVRTRLDELFGNGAPGSAEPWKMQRSSVFSFDPQTLQVDPTSDLGRNLLHLATRSFRSTGDIPYLITQHDLFQAHLSSLGAQPPKHAAYVVTTPPFTHSWLIASEKSVCDWMRPRRLVLPSSGRTLADRDARYFYFEIVQDAPGAFTPFAWTIDVPLNALLLSNSANLAQIDVHRVDASLSDHSDLTVKLSTADGLADRVRVLDWPTAPLAVLRDGVATASWSHDAQSAVLVLDETDGGLHTWTVVVP